MHILNDIEHRIFLSAMQREKDICKRLDDYEDSGVKLVPVCRSIERKVNEAIEPRKGHWIEHIERDDWNDYEERYLECSQCHYVGAEQAFDYCPNCGADMREVEK